MLLIQPSLHFLMLAYRVKLIGPNCPIFPFSHLLLLPGYINVVATLLFLKRKSRSEKNLNKNCDHWHISGNDTRNVCCNFIGIFAIGILLQVGYTLTT